MTVSNEYGHVDETGNAFLNTPEGPVKVGQFDATVGDSAAALKFFTQRFEDLLSEVSLALSRLKDGKASLPAVTSLIDRISKAIEAPNFLGDVATLEAKRQELSLAFEEQKKLASERKAALKAEAIAKREELTALAENLKDSTAWKATGEKFKELLDQWKKIPTVDRGKEQELWKRFSSARSAFDKARRTHFAELDAARAEALVAKQKLIQKAEALSTSTEWADTAKAFKRLMDEWKGLVRAAKGEEDKLWAQFKTAQDKFFTARNTAQETRDEELGKNLVAKQALLVEAEALLPITDVESAKRALRDIAEKWEKIGHVPRNDKEKIERRLKVVEDAVRKIEEEKWHRSKPEVIERANGLVASFESSLAKLDKQIQDAQAAKDQSAVAKLTSQREQTLSLLEAARSGASNLG